MEVYIRADLDYIMGFLRYGHYEGELEIPEEDVEIFKKDPLKYIKDNDLQTDLDIVVDDYSLEGVGTVNNVSYEEI